MADANLELLQAMAQRVLDGQRRIEVKLDRVGVGAGLAAATQTPPIVAKP